MPLVSVIMPAYNCEATIRMSIQSALRQTLDNLELIVVDDCSTDRTSDIIAELAITDLRLKHLTNPKNSGVASTRNRAIDASSGEFLAFLDSDDMWEPDKLEKQLTLMRETGCVLCYASYDYFGSNGRPVYRPYLVPETIDYNGLLKENVIGLSTVVLRRDTLGRLKFDEGIFHEDFALWLQLLREGVTAFGIPEVLSHNRIGGRSQNKWVAMKNRWRVYRVCEGLPVWAACWYLLVYAMAGMRKYRRRAAIGS